MLILYNFTYLCTGKEVTELFDNDPQMQIYHLAEAKIRRDLRLSNQLK